MDKKGRRGPTEIHLDNRRLHRAIPGLRGQRQSPDKNGRNEMTYSTKLSLACTTALIALGGAAAAQSVTIGITQNNVGVDSYQTTYEQAFIAAAEQNPDVEVVVLDAGGDVARQIAQIQDLIQQEVDAMIIWPTNG
jgi:ribose transport system substrate-binding protein